jgi:putative AdoMet-dependent methyltransferase
MASWREFVMRINELAQRLGVTPRAIRFYEEKGLLHPLKQADNGYRFYNEEDAWRLQTIVALREFGLPIEVIEQLLHEMDRGNQETVRHHLELQRSVLFSQWVQWKPVLAAMDEMIEQWNERQPPQFEDLFRLAEHIKELKSIRSSWVDRWNYDRKAADFDCNSPRNNGSPVGRMATAEEYELALRYTVQWIAPQSGETGLDIGAGTGNLTGRLLHEGVTMYAVEQSKHMLARCRAKLPSVSCKLGNFLALPFFEGQFHFVATSFAFHHLTEEQQLLALEEMNRVLKPQGRIVITGLMFEHADARDRELVELRACGRQELVTELIEHYPADRGRLLEWFRRHNYITVQQQLSPWIHMIYAFRKQ